MNKQKDWPEWANYKTVDLDGRRIWHELKPHTGVNAMWFSNGMTRTAGPLCNNWRDSLERRLKDNSNE